MPQRFTLALFLSLVLPTRRSAAQTSLSAHVDQLLIHNYRWRGILRASGWNAETEATARLGNPRTAFAVGAWTNIELGTHRDGAVTDLPAGHWGPSEYNLWGELSHSFHGAAAAAGFIWYQYRGVAGKLGTGEVYGRIRGSGLNSRRISPELSFWYDVAQRKSGYLDVSATAPVLALPFRGLGLLAYLGVAAAVAVGNPSLPPALAATTFERPGFTAGELSAGLRLHGQKSLQGLLFDFGGHVQYADDPAIRQESLVPPQTSSHIRFFFTFGVGFRWPAPKDF